MHWSQSERQEELVLVTSLYRSLNSFIGHKSAKCCFQASAHTGFQVYFLRKEWTAEFVALYADLNINNDSTISLRAIPTFCSYKSAESCVLALSRELFASI